MLEVLSKYTRVLYMYGTVIFDTTPFAVYLLHCIIVIIVYRRLSSDSTNIYIYVQYMCTFIICIVNCPIESVARGKLATVAKQLLY